MSCVDDVSNVPGLGVDSLLGPRAEELGVLAVPVLGVGSLLGPGAEKLANVHCLGADSLLGPGADKLADVHGLGVDSWLGTSADELADVHGLGVGSLLVLGVITGLTGTFVTSSSTAGASTCSSWEMRSKSSPTTSSSDDINPLDVAE